jgi:uncharacterized protein YecE (DUF72 family)
MRTGKIHIGTSGWSYKHWKEIYYPQKLKPTDYLSFYAKTFSISEINTSFYHLPKVQTIENWMAKVPKGFKFCPKISRYITHIKRLKEPDEPLQRFFDVFEPMKKMCGPVLVQLPPSLKFNEDVATYFFEALKTDYRDYDFALEVRHTTWLEKEPLELMRKYKVAFVISQSNNFFPYAEEVTAKNVYVRFHGPAALYASQYSEEQLEYFAEKFIAWSKEGRSIWAFFNNDIFGYAFKDASRLKEMVKALGTE